MSIAATVLIPTFDHGPTVLRSVRSALAQTVEDIEVFVVGDGAPDVTRDLMRDLIESDSRVRFFDNPKGPRHGEIHRHAALQEARGEIVCYLSDDDLWLPTHVEEMRGLLAESDFAHAFPLWVDGQGELRYYRVDLGLDYYRELLASGENRVPLSCGGHTLELYRRLPAGWRTTPTGTPTDLFMWQQILSVRGCRSASGKRPTVIHFPSPSRTDWTEEQRLEELDHWAERLSEPQLPHELTQRALELTLDEAAGFEGSNMTLADAEELRQRMADAADAVAAAEANLVVADRDRARLLEELERLTQSIAALEADRARLEATVAERERDVAARDRQLSAVASSVTWRLRARLTRMPLLAPALRSAARALARGAAPAETGSRHPGPTPARAEPATGSRAPDPPNGTTARRSDPSTR